MRSGMYLNNREKRKQRRILKLKIYGGLAVFFILFVGTGYLIVYSSLFQIRNITQTNADWTQTDADKIIGDLKNFFTNQSKITKFLGSENILIWKQEKISEFLKDRFQIAELTIEKDYFKRQIKINIKEREKFGIWCSISCWWFDKNGVIFAEALMAEGQLINKVNDFSGRLLKLGEPILEEKFTKNILKIFEVLGKSDLKIKSLKLENLELQEVVIDSPSIPKIYFSLRIDPTFTLIALESIKNLGFDKIEYIDFRVENRAYYKLK